jgi:hypothetical protein
VNVGLGRGVLQQLRRIVWYWAAMVLIIVVTACAYIYSNPYAIHQVIVVPYEAFDVIPGAEGMVALKGERGSIDFRLPNSTLSEATIAEVRHQIGSNPSSDFELMTRCVELVRSRLNARDATKPKARSTDAEHLYRHGLEEYTQCGEHAILLNEILQALGCQSRVLWLEGHVAAEYFDRDINRWVFVDAHMNQLFVDSNHRPMSVAEIIQAAERGLRHTSTPICAESEQEHSLGSREIDRMWYRNILLNGECYALSGKTLRDPSRWTHLIRFRRFPQMLVLSTNYDSSAGKYIETFQFRKYLLLFVSLVTGHYVLARIDRPCNSPAEPVC